MIHSSVACNLDGNILKAVLPLLYQEKVQAIEWSFDALFKVKNIPEWFVDLLQEFSKADRLIGHGIFFSMFSGRWTTEQDKWLAHLKKVSKNFNFQHITEHFGFMTGADFHKGAPIGIPYTEATLAIGIDRLKRIYNTCECPVGLENLAFAYSLDEVKKHGQFLERLVSPINGFIILDLHNLYCQLHNFDISLEEIIKLYPLDRVREIHISGGSWEDSTSEPDRKVRRDTHDDAVPKEVFNMLQMTISYCPNLKYVVLEQLGAGLSTQQNRDQYVKDFLELDSIISQANEEKKNTILNDFLPHQNFNVSDPLQSEELFNQQLELSHILESATDYKNADKMLRNSSLKSSSWKVEEWKPAMLETAIAIAQKWA